ncbi:ABC transporter substrate-binding protein (plasmid) [Entomospira entomophila]|uniref:ABC transporter substrate-binding protein n=1 Tax=Entomospira entomophila TaxID=2719988 RepID=A0A968KUC5_9SPIO|nr:ABC transporter substrate-binding protein [Entomospira entomophilus]NIZ41326.1 ABC transporter substrate-binding protein [Entomospira entomophilus]WDI36262.1 ABC transporter substrate-binding protein [Entomospira entomophilus]
MMKNMLKMKAYYLCLTLALLSILGCHSPTTTKSRIVTDQIGRSVELAQRIDTIVSVYYLTTSTTVALGKKDALIGIEDSIGSWGSLYELVAPELFNLPSVGSLRGIQIEEIMKLEPDVVILPKKLREQVDLLEKVGISVIVVDPETVESYEAMIRLLGEVYQVEERASQLIAYNQEQRSLMMERLEDVEPTTTVYISGGATMFNTAPNGMYQSDVIQLAKGRSVSSHIENDYWVNVSPEQLIAWNPDIWLMVQYAKYTEEEILMNPQLRNMQAIQNHRIYHFPSLIEPWDYPTSSSTLGFLWLVSLLHPEIYSQEMLLTDAKQFFQEFYGIEVDASDLGV